MIRRAVLEYYCPYAFVAVCAVLEYYCHYAFAAVCAVFVLYCLYLDAVLPCFGIMENESSSVTLHNSRILKDVKLGDIVRRAGKWRFYYHYGMILANNKVLHFTSPEGGTWHKGRKAVIMKQDFWVFANQQKVYIYKDLDKKYKPRPDEEMLRDAECCLEKGGSMEYHLFIYNCKDLVIELRYGIKAMKDQQVLRRIAYSLWFPRYQASETSEGTSLEDSDTSSSEDSPFVSLRDSHKIPLDSCTGSLSTEVEETRRRTSSKFCGTAETKGPDEDDTSNTSFYTLRSKEPPGHVLHPAESGAPATPDLHCPGGQDMIGTDFLPLNPLKTTGPEPTDSTGLDLTGGQ